MTEHFEKEIRKLTAVTNEIEEEENELGVTEEPEYIESPTTRRVIKKVTIAPKRKHKRKLLTTTTTTSTSSTTTPIPITETILLTTEGNGDESLPEENTEYETTTPETTDSDYFETTASSYTDEPEYPDTTEANEMTENIMYFPFVSSSHGCVQMNNNYSETGKKI